MKSNTMVNVVTGIWNRLQLMQVSKKSVVVLAYHNIEDRNRVGDDIYTVTTRNFHQHMSVIQRLFTAISPDQLFTDNTSSKPRICITFDDGKKNNVTQAFPILARFGLPAVFFIAPDLIGKEGFMTEDDITYVSQHNITIGSHGLTHADFGSIDIPQTERELKRSQEILRTLTLKEINTFAYPYGNPQNMKEEDKKILLQCNYTQAFIFGGNTAPRRKDPYRIPRLMVMDVLGTTFLSHVVAAFKKQVHI